MPTTILAAILAGSKAVPKTLAEESIVKSAAPIATKV